MKDIIQIITYMNNLMSIYNIYNTLHYYKNIY